MGIDSLLKKSGDVDGPIPARRDSVGHTELPLCSGFSGLQRCFSSSGVIQGEPERLGLGWRVFLQCAAPSGGLHAHFS